MTPRRRTQPAEELTDAQRRELTCVWHDMMSGPSRSAFESEAAKRRAWEAHGERLTAEFVADNPGRRPPGWWRYVAGMEGGPSALDVPGVKSTSDMETYPAWGAQAAWLHEAGVLTDEERAAIEEERAALAS